LVYRQKAEDQKLNYPFTITWQELFCMGFITDSYSWFFD